MYKPPLDPRDHVLIEEPTWLCVIVSYAMVATLPLLIWSVSRPAAGVVVLIVIGGLFVGGRHALRLIRRLYDCQKVTFDLGGKVKITVTPIPTDDAN